MKTMAFIKKTVYAIALFFCFGLFPTHAAQFEWFFGSIIINGEIVPGDHESLIRVMKYFDQPPVDIQLNSQGGNVVEAIKIGRMLNRTMTPVEVHPKKVCASSCFFILVGSPNRNIMGSLGIHRPYFDPKYFASLSASDAEKLYKKLQVNVTNYLLDVGVPRSFIDTMYTISSEKIKWIDGREFEEKIGSKSPFYEELLISKCGKELSDAEYKMYLALDTDSPVYISIRKTLWEQSMCEMNINFAELGKFMKELGLKASNPNDKDRWVVIPEDHSMFDWIVISEEPIVE